MSGLPARRGGAAEGPPAAGVLPPPPAEALAQSAVLVARIREEIAAGEGRIPFSRFMERCLYEPGLGYYRNASGKFGPTGDFVTAPEISGLFGACVARQAAEVLDALPGGVVLEAGAGSGRLAADLLRGLAGRGHRPRYLILEPSAVLRRRQERHLRARGWEAQVRWLEGFPEPAVEGVVIANEMLDALPASRIRIGGEGLREGHVAWRDGGFRLEWRPPSPALGAAWEAIRRDLAAPLPPGYVSEVNLAAPAWVATMASRLRRGLLLVFDYGYPRRELYHPERSTGTLACHYRHRVHYDPFFHPGLQDLATHLDFSALARSGREAGFSVAGFTTQAEFLLATGLLEAGAGLDPASEAYLRFAGAVKRLTLPAEMGEAVKALALTRSFGRPLGGFSGRDHRPRLG